VHLYVLQTVVLVASSELVCIYGNLACASGIKAAFSRCNGASVQPAHRDPTERSVIYKKARKRTPPSGVCDLARVSESATTLSVVSSESWNSRKEKTRSPRGRGACDEFLAKCLTLSYDEVQRPGRVPCGTYICNSNGENALVWRGLFKPLSLSLSLSLSAISSTCNSRAGIWGPGLRSSWKRWAPPR